VSGSASALSQLRTDELKTHQLYRARIVNEDDLINYRMQWMIYTQALLLATWGIFVQKFVGVNLGVFVACSYCTVFFGIVFAI
jgi:hypothetical protein